MSTENKNSFEWLWYVIGIFTGMLVVFSVTTHVGWILLGGFFGLIFGAVFLNKVVKGRHY